MKRRNSYFSCTAGAVVAVALLTQDAGALSYAEAVIADNPVAYFRMSETSGTAAADEMANHNGLYVGAADLNVPGATGPGFLPTNSGTGFDGIDAAVTTDISVNGLNQFTYELWVKAATAPQPPRTGLVGQNDVIEFGYIFDDTIQLWTPATGGLNVVAPSDGAWHHVVGLGDGNELQIWIDGAMAGSLPAPAVDYGISPFLVNIGGAGIFDAVGNHFNGMLDEVAIYTTALTQDQILTHFNARITPPTPSVPDGGTTALLGLLAFGGLGFLRRFMK